MNNRIPFLDAYPLFKHLDIAVQQSQRLAIDKVYDEYRESKIVRRYQNGPLKEDVGPSQGL